MKKLIIFALIFFAGFFILPKISLAAIPSSLGWYEIPNTKIRPLCPSAPTNITIL